MAPSMNVPQALLLLSPPTPSTMPPSLAIDFGVPPSNEVVSALAVWTLAERSAYLPGWVLRMPIANGTAIDGLFGFGGCGAFSWPQPGPLLFLPPVHTPASTSA